MTSWDWYQQQAAHLSKLSEGLRDPSERQKLMELSLGYRALARYAERQHHANGSGGADHHPERPADEA